MSWVAEKDTISIRRPDSEEYRGMLEGVNPCSYVALPQGVSCSCIDCSNASEVFRLETCIYHYSYYY
jgi:hypothetical protein